MGALGTLAQTKTETETESRRGKMAEKNFCGRFFLSD